MEITATKRLHHHAIPVILLLSGLLMISAIAIYGNYSSANEKAITRALVSRPIYFRPSSNGLAKITIDVSTPPSLDQAGQTAVLSFDLNAVNNQ